MKPPSRSGNMLRGQLQEANQKRKPTMKTKRARFDTLVARYYPAVYSFASRLTDDPREAVTDIMMPPKGPSSATRA